MIIKFFKGDDLIIGDERGAKISEMITAGAEWIEIDGGLYKVSNISMVLPSKKDFVQIGGVAKRQSLRDQVLEYEERKRRLES